MKIKNKDIKKIHNAVLSMASHQGDITLRWKLVKIGKKFELGVELFDREVQNLIETKGKGEQEKTLSTNDEDYIRLLELDIEVDCPFFSLKDLEQYSPTAQELSSLFPIIKEE